MPTGVYKRTPEMKATAKRNLALGHSKKARDKAIVSLRAVWNDEKKKDKVSDYNKKRMRDPEIRKRHLEGLKKSQKKNGINFRGGNGQIPVKIVKKWGRILEPMGFISEFVVPTVGHNTGLNPPDGYKIDFKARERDKIAIELDGPSHKPKKQRRKDEKKTYVLEALGWKVFRIKHR